LPSGRYISILALFDSGNEVLLAIDKSLHAPKRFRRGNLLGRSDLTGFLISPFMRFLFPGSCFHPISNSF
jgi:hypothetical protein